MFQVTIASATHTGMRKKENQDYHAYFPPEDGRSNIKGILLAVADGMGGRSGGALASRISVDILMQAYYKDMYSNIPKSLERAFLKANAEVLARGEDDFDLKGMASTLIAVVIKNDKMYHANVGDSRGYLIDGKSITQFTEDHSFVASLVKAGAISEEEALDHPEGHIITKAIGLSSDLKIDASESHLTIKKGQYILLCCDGLWGVVPNEEMLNIVNQYRTPDTVCEKLIEKANENGGPDNITVIVARLDRIDIVSSLVNKCIDLVR